MTTKATTTERLVMQTNKFRLANIATRQKTHLLYIAGAAVAIAATAATIVAL